MGADEALHRRVVIPGPHAIHAGLRAVSLQERLVGAVSVLTPPDPSVESARERVYAGGRLS